MKRLLFIALAAAAGCASLPYGIHDKDAEPGFAYMLQGDWDSAIVNLTNRIGETPDRFGLYALRAKAFYNKGVLGAAVADWSKAIELEQTGAGHGALPALYSDRGAAYYSLGRCEDAIADINRSLAARESSGDHAIRGGCYESLGRFEPALADFDAALASDASLRLALGGRVDCLIFLKRWAEALDTATRYLNLHPNDGRYVYMQGVAYFHLGQTEKARAIAQRAFITNEYSERIFGNGRELEMFDLDGRRETVHKALETSRKLESAEKWKEALDALLAGWDRNLALTTQDKTDAAELRQEIFKVYPHLKEKPVLPEYARRYQVEGESYKRDAVDFAAPAHALASFEQLAAVVPWYPPAYYQAALLRGLMGDYAGAISEMKVYMQLAGGSKEAGPAQDKIYEWEARLR